MNTKLEAAEQVAALLREARDISDAENFEGLVRSIDDTIHDEASPLVESLEEEDDLTRHNPFDTMVADERAVYRASVL